jgi:hypothetical protein
VKFGVPNVVRLPDDLSTPVHHMTKPITMEAVELDGFRGVTLLQRGQEDLIALASGTTGTDPDTDCRLETRFQIASISGASGKSVGSYVP